MGMKLFTASGTFKPSDYGITATDRVDIIVVGGGQGGSNGADITGHGGNSGCHNEFSGFLNPDTDYAVTVGPGGAGATPSNPAADGVSGSASSFGTLVTAQGGSNTVFGAVGGFGGGPTIYCGGAGAGGLSLDKPSFCNGTSGNRYASASSEGNGGTGGVGSSVSGYTIVAGHSLYGGIGGQGAINGGNGDCGAVGGAYASSNGGGGAGGGYGAGGGQGGYNGTANAVIGIGGKGADGCVVIFW